MSTTVGVNKRLTISEVVAISSEGARFDRLVDWIGDRRFVMLGEASHGTQEFYAERASLTKRLIEDGEVCAVAVEADWPDAYRVNRYVLGISDDLDSVDSLGDFKRFPAWMWRNEAVVEFVEWLRHHNDAQSDPSRRTRFFGLDLYSLRASMEAVVEYLDQVDPEAATRARNRYGCFDLVSGEGSDYARAVSTGRHDTCENEVVEQLLELRRRSASLLSRDGLAAEDEYFFAEQNARLVRNAERYYRTMYHGQVSSWNLRDHHMAETLRNLELHLRRVSPNPRMIVWEHNSHIGDARSTEMGWSGELNVGQLARSMWGADCFLVGFTTHHGTVSAASNWGAPVERKNVRPALPGSFEDLFHDVGVANFYVQLGSDAPESLNGELLERAIGVIYRPETERSSHWFRAHLAHQFDAVVHLDETSAVRPLDFSTFWEVGEPPETFPSGL